MCIFDFQKIFKMKLKLTLIALCVGFFSKAQDSIPKTTGSKQTHPIIREHPETGRKGIFGTFGYTIGIEGMEDQDAMQLLIELSNWQSQEQFQYRHKWKKNMLVMWDNRSVLHKATGGYQGHERLLHRTTIAAYES